MRPFCLLLLGLILRSVSALAADCPGGTPGITIFFANGLNKTEEDAQASLEKLESAVLDRVATTPIPAGCLNFDYVYNTNEALFLDYFEAASQRLDRGISAFWRMLGNLETTPDSLQQAFLELAKRSDVATYVRDADLQKHVARYREEILNAKRRVVVVAHSQGNLYANAAYKILFTSSNPVPPNSFSIIAVATPASSVEGDGPYVTVCADIIQVVPGSRLANTHNNGCFPCGEGFSVACHHFVDSYLAGADSKAKILDGIVAAICNPACPTGPIDDNFDDNSLNPTLWLLESPPTIGLPGTVSETNRRLEMTMGAGLGGAGIVSICQFTGSFDVQVDYLLLNWPANNRHSVQLRALGLGQGPFGSPGPFRFSGTQETHGMVFLDRVAALLTTTETSGKLRLVRAGPILLGSIYDGTTWRPLGLGFTSTDPVRTALEFGSSDSAAAGGVRVAFDNFKVNGATTVLCPPVLPPASCPTKGLVRRNLFTNITSISTTAVSRGQQNTRAVIVGNTDPQFVLFDFLNNVPLPQADNEVLCDMAITFEIGGLTATPLNPTQDQRFGRWAGWPPIIDPLTGLPFPGNGTTIPLNRIGSLWVQPALLTVDPSVPPGMYRFTITVSGQAVASGSVMVQVQ